MEGGAEGYDYVCIVAQAKSINPPPSYTVRRYPHYGAKTLLFEFKIQFKIVRRSDGGFILVEEMGSETFYASPMLEKFGGRSLFWAVARRMASYGMSQSKAHLFALFAYVHASAAAEKVDAGDVISTVVTVQVLTIQRDGEDLESTRQRCITPHNKLALSFARGQASGEKFMLENNHLCRWMSSYT